MNPQKLIVLIFVPFLVLGSIAIFYWLVFRGTLLGFISTNTRYAWSVDRRGLQGIENVYRRSGLKSPVLIRLSGKDKFLEDYAMGWDRDDVYVFTAEWTRTLGVPTLLVYVNEEALSRVPDDRKSFLTTTFLNLRMGQFLNLSKEEGEFVNSLIYEKKEKSPLGLTVRFSFK